MSNDLPGLRDRKRAQTRARIEAAAVELVLRDGLEAATIDAISERADVSPRTFFNYFDSKDAAILGLQAQELDDEIGRELVGADGEGETDAVTGLVAVVVATLGVADTGAPDLHQSRVEAMRRHPEILGGQFAQLNARKDFLIDQAVRLAGRDPRFDGDPELAAHAGVLLALCGSAVRTAVEDWARTTDLRRARTSHSTEDDIDAVKRRAVDLVHSTLERLACP